LSSLSLAATPAASRAESSFTLDVTYNLRVKFDGGFPQLLPQF